MHCLELLLLFNFSGAFLAYLVGKIHPKIRDTIAVIVSLSSVAITAWLYGRVEEITYLKFLGLPLILRINNLSWVFAIAVSIFGFLSIIFSLSYMEKRDRLDFYYFAMLLVHASMLGIVFSGDMVSFYIFWEIMSWTTFLLISYNRAHALAAGMKYIIMCIIGSVSMLIGILSLYASYHTLALSQITSKTTSVSPGYALFILVLFSLAFGIKNAIMPFHTWLPDSYTYSVSPFTAVLSGMLTRMGIYGFILLFYVIVGIVHFLNLGSGILKFNYIIAWLGAITIVIPTFIAMLQNDAKQLLAWHGIGQGGYMILGIAFGTSLGFAGGLFHTLNHAIYIVLLFMSVGAIEYRCNGVRDLNSLGGLIKKMPVTFIGALLGISGLIGIPLTNGFVSKWLIYKTLIIHNAPFLAFAALIGTWGTMLSVYKFLHNIFLGQIPEKYKNIEKAPFSMQLPMVILSLTILLFGILPGIPLKIINSIGTSLGFPPLNVNIWGVASETGTLNTLNIFTAVLISFIVFWLIYRTGGKKKNVSQDNTYAAGSYIPKDKYHYTVKFYNPLHRMIEPYLKDFIDIFYTKLVLGIRWFADRLRRVYTGDIGYYTIYILIFLVFLILIKLGIKVW